ncbi:MAG: tryptophan synthase subunit alpha, partial [Bdellovibrionales bacterium]|nr:tryptophan synthase subunit alpha [Bdellovibrionales bacterium]
MGYFNPMLQFGVEKFLSECQRVGVDGLIIPDIPLDEYEEHYETLFKKYDIGITFLVLPQTPPERLKLIDGLSTDFIYAVSNPSTTGGSLDIGEKQREYYERIEQAGLDTPVQIGFGISDKESFESATKHFAGGIIGSAFIRALQGGEDYLTEARNFVRSIRGDKT